MLTRSITAATVWCANQFTNFHRIKKKKLISKFISSKVCTGNWVQECCHIHCRQWRCYLSCYFAEMLEISLLVQIGSGNNYLVIDVKVTPGAIVPSKFFHRYTPFLGVMQLVRFMALRKSFGYQQFRRKRNIWILETARTNSWIRRWRS